MEAFRLSIREEKRGVHKTGVGGCIDRVIRANRLKVARVSNDLRDFRQLFQLIGHETSGKFDCVDLWNYEHSNLWEVWCCILLCGNGILRCRHLIFMKNRMNVIPRMMVNGIAGCR